MVVEEQIDGCGSFTSVPFELKKTDPNFGVPPAGFQYLKIETSDRYDVGVGVIYRVQIDGNFPEAAQPIKVKAGTQIITFNCDPGKCFIVPSCPPSGKLVIVKKCEEVIKDNRLTLKYTYDITNQGNAPISLVEGTARIIFDANNFTLGTIIVDPASLNVDTSTPGIIVVTGTVGPILPGEVVKVAITVPIQSISAPNTYLVTANTTAVAADTTATVSCVLNIDAVQLLADKCCSITEGNKGAFRITVASVGNSPQTSVGIVDKLIIPQDVTVQFQGFDGCTATLGDGSPVPLNSNITNATINVKCSPLTVPKGGSVQKNIKFTVVSTTSFQSPSAITNTLQEVSFLNGATQIFLGVTPVPVSASVNVLGTVQCQKPCSA